MSQLTRAIVCHDDYAKHGWSVDEIRVREPREGELLIKMVASGICHADVLAADGPAGKASGLYPRVVGQEGSGFVVSTGPGVTVAKPGDAVVLSSASCQKCIFCKSGHESNCQEFKSLNTGGHSVFSNETQADISGKFFGQSSFAALSIVDQSSVVNVSSFQPSEAELLLFSSLGSGFLAGSAAIVTVAKAGPEDTVLVIGGAAVGLASILIASNISKCKKIVCLDKLQPRLDLAKAIGATHIVNGDILPEGKTMEEVILEITDGVGATITIESTGGPPLFETALKCTRGGGKIIPVSPSFPGTTIEIPYHEFMLSGIQILGAFQGQTKPSLHIPQMIKWYRDGLFAIDKLSKFYPVEEFAKGIEEMYEGTAPKPILVW